MCKLIALFRKFILTGLVLVISMTAVPAIRTSAAGLRDDNTPPTSLKPDYTRLENTWARQQKTFQHQEARLDKAGEFIARIQSMIDQAAGKGKNITAVQAALDAFAAVVPAARSAHAEGTAIISSHAGFNSQGKVLDRTTAITTVRSLARVIKDTRTAMGGTGRALIEAVRAFRSAHRPTLNPAP